MAFQNKNLSVIAYANGFTLWHYAENVIKAIMRRTTPKQKETVKIIEDGDMKLYCDDRRAFVAGKEMNLTAKEFDVLELLVLNPNKVYSRESLLKLIWGNDYPGPRPCEL